MYTNEQCGGQAVVYSRRCVVRHVCTLGIIISVIITTDWCVMCGHRLTRGAIVTAPNLVFVTLRKVVGDSPHT